MADDFRVSALTAVFEAAWLAIAARHPGLPERVAFTLATAVRGQRVSRWGHWAPGTWTKRRDGELVGEVFVAAERLEAGAESVMETVLHEAAHALASARDVRDTSNRGRYHNRKYKGLAEGLGLEVRRNRTYAWAETALPGATARVYEKEIAAIDRALTAYRQGSPHPTHQDEKVKPLAKRRSRLVFECDCIPPREVAMTEANAKRGPVGCGICGATFRPLALGTSLLQALGIIVTHECIPLTVGEETPRETGPPDAAPTEPSKPQSDPLADAQVISLRDGGELLYLPMFLSPEESAHYLALFKASIPWKLEEGGNGKRQHRRTSWHAPAGVVYAYRPFRLEPQPFTAELEELRDRVVRLTGVPFNTVLCNRYRDGRDFVGWHADNERIFGLDPVIASASFGAPRPFLLRHRRTGETVELVLRDGSVLIMRGTVQRFYVHSLPVDRKVRDERINLTFRVVVDAATRRRSR